MPSALAAASFEPVTLWEKWLTVANTNIFSASRTLVPTSTVMFMLDSIIEVHSGLPFCADRSPHAQNPPLQRRHEQSEAHRSGSRSRSSQRAVERPGGLLLRCPDRVYACQAGKQLQTWLTFPPALQKTVPLRSLLRQRE